MDFAETIGQTNFSMFPLDLKAVNNIMEKFFMYVRMLVYNIITIHSHLMVPHVSIQCYREELDYTETGRCKYY